MRSWSRFAVSSKLHTKQTTRTAFYRLLAIKYVTLVENFAWLSHNDKEIYCTCNLVKDSFSFRTPRARVCKFQGPGRPGDWCVLWVLSMVLGSCYASGVHSLEVPSRFLEGLCILPSPRVLSMGTYKTVLLLRVVYIVFASLCSFVFEAWRAVQFLLIGRSNCHI